MICGAGRRTHEVFGGAVAILAGRLPPQAFALVGAGASALAAEQPSPRSRETPSPPVGMVGGQAATSSPRAAGRGSGPDHRRKTGALLRASARKVGCLQRGGVDAHRLSRYGDSIGLAFRGRRRARRDRQSRNGRKRQRPRAPSRRDPRRARRRSCLSCRRAVGTALDAIVTSGVRRIRA